MISGPLIIIAGCQLGSGWLVAAGIAQIGCSILKKILYFFLGIAAAG